MSIQQLTASFESLIAAKGITPATRDAAFVESLVYVTIPLSGFHTRNRGGANPEEVSMFFDGGFMSTCSKQDGRSAKHTSMPFLMFMTDKARVYAPVEGSVVKNKAPQGATWTTSLEEVKWFHTVTGMETTKVQPGERIPYNFRLSFTSSQLLPLGITASGYDAIWHRLLKLWPAMQPQLHLVLSVSKEAYENAKVEKVHNQDRWAMKLELRSADVLESHWVLQDSPLYDKAANIPTLVVNNRSNFERVAASNGASTIAVTEVGLANPEHTLRKLVAKKVKKEATNTRPVLLRIVNELNGQLEVWWNHQTEDKREKLLASWADFPAMGKTPKPKATIEAQKEAAAPKTEEDIIFDFSELDALLNAPIEAAPAKLKAKPATKAPVKAGGSFSSTMSDDDFDSLDEI